MRWLRLNRFTNALVQQRDRSILTLVILPSHEDFCAAQTTGSTKRNAESMWRIRGALQSSCAPRE